ETEKGLKWEPLFTSEIAAFRGGTPAFGGAA
uniref:3-hydroxyacyl-CoA dehydrogenase n=1 Tax=Steinernema glaseri TaxID=37863 RepID=A0A1I7YPD8_9BILA